MKKTWIFFFFLKIGFLKKSPKNPFKKNRWKIGGISTIFLKNRRFFYDCLRRMSSSSTHTCPDAHNFVKILTISWNIANFIVFWVIFHPINRQLISFQPPPISDISPKFWPIFSNFQTLCITHLSPK